MDIQGHLHSLDWNSFSFTSYDNKPQGIVIFLFGIAQYVPVSRIVLSCSDKSFWSQLFKV